MAHIGKDGIVTVAGNDVGSMRSFTVDTVGETVDTTAMGDDDRTFVSTIQSWTGSIDAIWVVDTDTAQGALNVGDSVALVFLPEGDTSGDFSYSGTGIVTGVSTSTSYDDIGMVSFSVQGTGALTEGTVS